VPPTKKVVAKPVKRLTLSQLLRATPSAILSRANNQCHVVRKQYDTGSKDGFRRTFVKNKSYYNEMRVRSTCTDGPRNSYVRFFGKPDKDTECWVWCSCPYFCVDGSTIISTTEGLRQIKETVGKVTTLTMDGVRDGDTFDTGVADTLLLTTIDGFQIRATPNERFSVITPNLEQKWRRLDELRAGEYITLKPGNIWPENPVGLTWNYIPKKKKPYKRMIAGKLRNVKSHVVLGKIHETPKVMTKELARILGYLVAEGGGDRNTITFPQNEGPVLDDYRHCWEATFPTAHLTVEVGKSKNHKRLSCRSVYIVAFLKSIGHDMTLKSRSKCIPWSVLQSTKEHVIEFLRGYFEGDGTCSGKQVACSTVSKELAQGIQKVLLNLGIRTGTSQYTPAAPYENNTGYTVVASGEDTYKFLDTIGFAVRKYKADSSVGRYGRSIPYAGKLLRECVQPSGYYVVEGNRLRLKLWDHRIFSTYYKNGTTDSLPENTLHRYINSDYGRDLKLVSPEVHERLQDILENDLEWTKIKSIDSPKKVQTYDAMVPDTEHFVANGFVVHNTYNLEVALARYNSSSVRSSNGDLPRIRNPKMIPYLCKHLVVAARLALAQRKDKAKQRLEEEQKRKAAEVKKQTPQKKPLGTIPKGQFTQPSGSADLIELP